MQRKCRGHPLLKQTTIFCNDPHSELEFYKLYTDHMISFFAYFQAVKDYFQEKWNFSSCILWIETLEWKTGFFHNRFPTLLLFENENLVTD